MSASIAVWIRYRTDRWHAWLPGAERSLCRYVTSRPPEASHRRPNGHPCSHCLARLRHAVTSPAHPPKPHRSGDPCACADCRQSRRERASDHAALISETLEAAVCRCVREWPRAEEYVADAQARVAALLLAWECSGDVTGGPDVLDACRALRAAWKEAERRYDVLDGSHPCRQPWAGS